MRCSLLLALFLLPAGMPAAASEEFTTPAAANEVMQARDLPFRLHFDPDKWQLQPQHSKLALLARVVHEPGDVAGAFDYRRVALSEAELRQRERDELDTAFREHAVEGFERRLVNGREMLFMRARATTENGREVVVRSYLWRGPEGVADYGLVVNRDRFERHRDDMLALLNGFEIAADAEQDD